MTLQERSKKLIEEFLQYGNWEDRYGLLIQKGKELDSLEDCHRIDGNLLKGCQSKLWLYISLVEGNITINADSDSSITKGMAALFIEIYSNARPDDVLCTKPEFIEKIGFKEHLTSRRLSGMALIMKKITIHAIAFKAKQESKQ